MKCIKVKGIEVVVYELIFEGEVFFNLCVIKNFDEFKSILDVIVLNCMVEEL